MCGHLLAAGYPVTVYNRSREKAEASARRGAAWAGSPATVAAASDVVFTIVGYPADVREVILGPDGALAGAARGGDAGRHDDQRAVPCGRDRTRRRRPRASTPSTRRSPAATSARRNARSRSWSAARRTPSSACRPLLRGDGQDDRPPGPAGAGQHTKMVNQILIATNMIGVCEALLYGYKAGLDSRPCSQTVGSGAARLVELEQPRPAHHRRQLRPRASSSSTSSRTWASPWPRRGG